VIKEDRWDHRNIYQRGDGLFIMNFTPNLPIVNEGKIIVELKAGERLEPTHKVRFFLLYKILQLKGKSIARYLEKIFKNR